MPDDDPEDLIEPPDYPQQQREWHGGWLSVVLPILILAAVAGVVMGYFWLSTS